MNRFKVGGREKRLVDRAGMWKNLIVVVVSNVRVLRSR